MLQIDHLGEKILPYCRWRTTQSMTRVMNRRLINNSRLPRQAGHRLFPYINSFDNPLAGATDLRINSETFPVPVLDNEERDLPV